MKEFLQEATSLAPAEIYANESRLTDFAKGMEAEYKHLTTWHDIVGEHPKESDLYLLRDAKLNVSASLPFLFSAISFAYKGLLRRYACFTVSEFSTHDA